MEEDIYFSQKQLDFIEKVIKDEMTKVKKEIDDNYIPRLVIEEMLRITKEQKEKYTDKEKEIFFDSSIWTYEQILKKE